MLIAYKIKIKTNNKENDYLYSCSGAARYVWNWGLAKHDQMFRDEQKPRWIGGNADNPHNLDLRKCFRVAIPTEHPWMREYSSHIINSVFSNLKKATDNFWRKQKNGEVAKTIAQKKADGSWNKYLKRQLKNGRKGIQVSPHYPQYKSKHRSRVSFTLETSIIRNGYLILPAARNSKWGGHRWRLCERRLPDGKYKTTTVSQDGAGNWFVSLLAERELVEQNNSGVVGIDIGVAVAVATSDGRLYANNNKLIEHERKKQRLQRELSRREKFSQNWLKTKAKIKKLDHTIKMIRNNNRHNITADIVYNLKPQTIVVEDLSIKNMTGKAKPKPNADGTGYLPNRKKQKSGLNKALLEVAPFELRRQLEYKAKFVGADVIAVNPAYTSQTCSCCGHVAKENRKTRDTFVCVSCGFIAHADINAAINIKNLA